MSIQNDGSSLRSNVLSVQDDDASLQTAGLAPPAIIEIEIPSLDIESTEVLNESTAPSSRRGRRYGLYCGFFLAFVYVLTVYSITSRSIYASKQIETTVNRRSTQQRPFLTVDGAPAPLPKAETIPSQPQAAVMHASDALQCRESVVNFVINATDGKDECDGLIKAFEKSCNTDDTDSVHHRQLLSKRRYQKKVSVNYTVRFRTLLYETHRILKRATTTIFKFVGLNREDPFFFAEDKVFEAWDNARYIVENDLVESLQHSASQKMRADQCILQEQRKVEKQQRTLLANERDVEEGNEISNTTKRDTTHHGIPMKLPSHTVTEKSAGDALMLQQSEKMIKAANETIADAQEEAAKSKKSISDTSAALSAVLNDPNSIEARTCCASILNVYTELCSTDEESQVSDQRLFFLVTVMALCGVVKSLIRHYKILWLPEAAGCIIVGVLSGYALDFFPHQDISFDAKYFLRILVPPIIFEAALSIDKRSFSRHMVPIVIYSVIGTLVATLLTAEIVHNGTTALSGWCAPIPYVEALTFGALISSIDPIAVLSVLSNMGMNDTDTIYVLIFGESLLNDGVAIVLFHTLVHFLDETLVIDREVIIGAIFHFFVVAFGSLLVGVASGMMSTLFFWMFHGCSSATVEVLMFFCWALLPYYVCDGIGWSGIVSCVAVGFVMDLHVVGQMPSLDEPISDASEHTNTSYDSGNKEAKPLERVRRRIFNAHGHLSAEARAHIGFVAEIVAAGMETAIFAYLGFFLFSHRYHWDLFHMIISIVACLASRGIMIPTMGFVANWITRIQQRRANCLSRKNNSLRAPSPHGGVIVDKKMQIALWFAGLRGAMSFALVEHIPLYDSTTGEGTRLKPELKAMTSASIMFTVFVLGGYTHYMMQGLGITAKRRAQSPVPNNELDPLIGQTLDGHDEKFSSKENDGPAKKRVPHLHKESSTVS